MQRSVKALAPALLCATLILAAAPALANGAMSLALATFTWPLWLVYVAVTIVFEGLALGRLLHVPAVRALPLSVAANALTAILGGFISGIVAYGFYGVFGSRLNPNPFGQTLIVFTLFGIGSALIEGAIWHHSAFDVTSAATLGKAYVWSLAVHLAAVFIGLAVLLSPTRPYGGLEGQAIYHRTWYIEQQMCHALDSYIAEHQALPNVSSYEELLRLMQPHLDGYERDQDLWAAAYVPKYARFDTGQSRQGPTWEWNPAATGLRLSNMKVDSLWLARVRLRGATGRDWCEGLVMSAAGDVHRTTGCSNLGYDGRQGQRQVR